jgi:replicative DNA helicase
MSEQAPQNPFGRKRHEQATAEELLASINKALPFSDEAEKGVISCLLQDPEGRMTEARNKLPPDGFYHEANRTIYSGLLELADDNKPLDPVLLTNHLRDKGLLERVGGPAAITEIFTFVPSPSHFVHYLKIVMDKWLLRRLIHAAALITDGAQNAGEQDDSDVVEMITAAESRLFSLVEAAQSLGESREGAVTAKEGVANWVDHLQRTIDNRGKVLGLTTGIHEIDQTLHGIDDAEGEICVIAGRPAMGKTAMAGTVANHLAVEMGCPGLIFSIEMSANQLYTRLVLGPAGVDTSKAITGHFSREDHAAISVQSRKLQQAPLLVCASAAVSTADLRAQVQLAKRRHGIRWIMVDHLHLVKSVNPKVQGDERMRLVEVMETLQFLKKEHHLGIFLLVQMNRDSDKNPGKPPVLADLAGSAAIEQYADHVLFLHREDEYAKWHRLTEDKQKAWRDQIEPRRDRSPQLWSDGLKYAEDEGGFARQDYEEKAMLFVRKNRRGPTPELQVRYVKELTRFSTRMPKLNSSDSRDWQMGTYTAKPRKQPASKHVSAARMETESVFGD